MSYLSEISHEEREELAARIGAYILMPRGSKAAECGVEETKLFKFINSVNDALIRIGIEDTVQSMIARGVLENVPGKPGFIQRGPNWKPSKAAA